MTVQMIVDRDSGRTFVLFAVTGVDDDYVSVVGSFNGWVPGVHILHPQSDGTRTALIEVEHPGDVHFRYLASGSRWFDDPTADLVNEHGSTVFRRDGSAPAEPQPVKVAVVPVVTTSDAPVAKATVTKAAAKKSAAKKAAAKTVAKKTAAKKTAASDVAPAKKAAAKNAPAKKSAAKKPAAKKSAAKKAAKKSSST